MTDNQSLPREPLQPAHFEPLDIPSALQKLRFVSRVLDNFAQAPVSDRADANQFVKELIEAVWKSGRSEQPAIEAVRLANQAKDWAHRASKTFYEHISRGYLEAMDSAIDSLAALAAPIAPAAGSEQSVPAEWMPIESAPKDGTAIYVVVTDALKPEAGVAHWFSDTWRGGQGIDWQGTENPHEYFGVYPLPTHWMPLPKPPAIPGEAS